MLIFTYKVREHFGQKGFDGCMEEKCSRDPELSWCLRDKEIYKCCLGSNGQLGQQDGKLTCLFS